MKISFLFGSGADTDACKSLMSGQEFSKSLILNHFYKEIQSITGIDASRFRLIRSNSTKVFVQTIVNHKNEALSIFGHDVVNNFINYHYGSKDIDYSKQIRGVCEGFYTAVTKDDDHQNPIKDFFLKNAVLFDSLDEKFNSLRETNYSSNAKRVINAYLSVFLLIFKNLYTISKDFNWSYSDIYEVLRREYDISLCETSYYSTLAKSNLDCYITTTNYTEVVEKQTKHNDVVHLHGKLTWFEDLEKLIVYDCTNTNELTALKKSKNIIPFILIPSGVKPLVCKRQIAEFYKFIENLNSSKYLVVIGYKFNSEDNHINSIIGEWLSEPQNRLIYINYKNTVDFSRFNWSKDFSIDTKEFCNNDKIITDRKITNICVTDSNSRRAFEAIVNKLKDQQNGNI